MRPTERNKKRKDKDVIIRDTSVEKKKYPFLASIGMSKPRNKIFVICAALAMVFIFQSKRLNELASSNKPAADTNSKNKTPKFVGETSSVATNKALGAAKLPTQSNNNSTTNNNKKDPLKGWIYEPKNVNFFWKKMGDRPFLRELYSHVGKYKRVIDVGARGYNRYCKDLINSTTTEYYQIEPFPPSNPEEINNDGLLECYMGEVMDKYPGLKNSFDLLLDFGVFGWKPALDGFNNPNGIRKYVENVVFLLKDRGMWVLKVDTKEWVPNPDEFMGEYVLPYFEIGDFENGVYKSGHSVKGGNFKFYFLHKK